MRQQVLLTLATIALLSAACSEAPETIVGGSDGTTDTVAATTLPGERPADQPTTTTPPNNDVEPHAEPMEEPPELEQATTSTATVAPEIEQDPDPIGTIDNGPDLSWQDQPLAHVVLTADDLPALGLDSGWELNWVDFNELDESDHIEEEVCGTPVPIQTSYFVASFDEQAIGMELDLNVMPAAGGTAASDYLTVLELVATCPNLEDDLAAVSMEMVAITVDGAEQSIVIAGTDGTSPSEPVGLTLAAAEVDGHLFLAFVSQDSGTPASGDAELAARALALSISRI